MAPEDEHRAGRDEVKDVLQGAGIYMLNQLPFNQISSDKASSKDIKKHGHQSLCMCPIFIGFH